MHSRKSWLILSLAAVFLVAGGCTNDNLDDGDSADVILQVVSMDARPVTANLTTATQGTCSSSGVLCQSTADCGLNETCVRASICVFEVEEWSIVLQAAPKNPLAVPPYNDVVMETVQVSYQWVDTGYSTPTRVFGLAGVTIPADGSNSVKFFPITGQDLLNLDQGITGNLTMTFNGRTVEGTAINGTVGAELYIETCN